MPSKYFYILPHKITYSSFTKFQVEHWHTQNIMPKCFDHERTFLDTHSKILLNSYTYKSKIILWITPKEQLEKQLLGFATYGIGI